MGLMDENRVDVGFQGCPICLSCSLAPRRYVTNYAGTFPVYRDQIFMSWESLFDHLEVHQELGHYIYLPPINKLKRECQFHEVNNRTDSKSRF